MKEMFKKQARDRIDGGSEGTSGGSVKYKEPSSPKLLVPPPPPPPPPQQSSSLLPFASGTGLRKQIQTVKKGTQTNKNTGNIRIGNISCQFNPASMAATKPFFLEFQTVQDGIQTNENSGDIEIGSWG
ncbi:uncharacterized protein LOC122640670 isoform X1 [Telopea speciosissima]|uniref:uncharacterized protein LOC122640670 isoform X1 n=1 Tax=Telopea speciosissima TaxID=54955 RepID=UPI001CC720D7|nr:uncharacterized protein LOC122640670 isoform X1 [Telopea speciosissima]